MNQTRNRRHLRSLLQNRRVQLIHALLIVTYLAVYTLLLSAAALAPTLLALRGDASHATLADAAELFLFENRVWPLALLLIAGCGVHSILMSHRVFGPLVRVRHEAARIGDGDLTRRVRFRKNDHLLDLRDALNAMVDRLDRRMGEVHVARARCAHRLEVLRHGGLLGTGGSSRRQLFEDLYEDFVQLEQRLAGFKTSGGEERLKPLAPAATEAASRDGGADSDTHSATQATNRETRKGQDGCDTPASDQARSA